jgi:ribosome-associated protein
MTKTNKISFLKLSRKAAKITGDKKASDIALLNVRRLTEVADYFIIATVDSSVQMNAIADAIEKDFIENESLKPIHKEGRNKSSWLVLDYGGLVVHIMTPQARTLYALERIWSQARKLKVKI